MPHPTTHQPHKRERQRRLVLRIATLALVSHVLVVAAHLQPVSPSMVIMGSLGVLLMAGLLWVNRATHHPGWTLTLALMLNGGWLLVDGRRAIQHQEGLTSWIQSDALFIVLLCYTFLPLRTAHVWNGVVLVVLSIFSLLAGEKDLFLLLLAGFVMSFVALLTEYGREVSDAQATSALLRQELNYDVLTGALSRRETMRRLQASAEQGQPGFILLLDLDHFKQVNDDLGHHVGDQALQIVTQLLKKAVRPGDAVGRWGGKEFLVFLPGATLTQAQEIADRLLRDVNSFQNAGLPRMTISMGGVPMTPGTNVNEALKLADLNLYRAKDAGRNCAVLTAPPAQQNTVNPAPVNATGTGFTEGKIHRG